MWFGAEGVCIDPQPAGKFGAEILIHSSWADKNWQAVNFPEDIRDHIKFRNLTIINDKYYVVPQAVGLPEIAAVVAIGDTLEGAIEEAKEYAEQIEGYYIDSFPNSLDSAQEEIDKLKKVGIAFKPSSYKKGDTTISEAMKIV
jgi:predicted RNase H-like HicB family nuclease